MDKLLRGSSSGCPGAVPDFTKQVESPDQRRIKSSETRFFPENSFWRASAAAKTRSRNVKYLEDSPILQVPRKALGDADPQLVIVVGAFIKRGSVDMTDLLCYTLKVLQPVVARPFSVVYFHTDAQLPAILDVGWFSQLHASLPSAHRENLRSIYVVHPSPRLRMWLLLLKANEPEVYSKVVCVDSLTRLCAEAPGIDFDAHVPQHVKDAEGYAS